MLSHLCEQLVVFPGEILPAQIYLHVLLYV